MQLVLALASESPCKLAGIPAISFPAAPRRLVPIGLQLIGAVRNEPLLLQLPK